MSSSTVSPAPATVSPAPVAAPAPVAPAMDFETALERIKRNHADSERALSIVFVAVLRDLFHSKSTERANMAARALSALPVWPEFCKRLRLAYGGSVIEPDMSKATADVENSCLHYVKKFNGFMRMDIEAEKFQLALQFFDCKLSSIPWNSYKYAKKETKQTFKAKDLQAFFVKIRDNSQNWNMADKEVFDKFVSAVAPIFE